LRLVERRINLRARHDQGKLLQRCSVEKVKC
jgi:uncharacterized protein (DUF1778 family)